MTYQERLPVAEKTPPATTSQVDDSAISDRTENAANTTAFRGLIPGLDGVRGLAVLLVLLFHGFSGTMRPLFEPHRYHWTGLPALILKLTEPLSGGVEIFFVLSGFLITRSLLEVGPLGRSGILDFYRRRFARLVPLYSVLLVILVIAGCSLPFLLVSSVFLANFVSVFHLDIEWPAIWSISVEVQFYLIWPLLLLRFGTKGLKRICIAIVALSPVLRFIGMQHGYDIYSFTPFRLDGLALGSWLSLMLFSGPQSSESVRFNSKLNSKQRAVPFLAVRRLSRGLIILFAGFVLSLPSLLDRETALGQIFSFEIWQLLSTGLILMAIAQTAQPSRENWLTSRALRKTGEWSYGIFLIHPVLFAASSHLISMPADPTTFNKFFVFIFTKALVVSILSFMLARLSFKKFERPAARLLNQPFRQMFAWSKSAPRT